MENNDTEVVCVLLHAPVFLSFVRAHLLDEPKVLTLVMVGAEAWDTLDVWRFVKEHDASEIASLLSQAPVFRLTVGVQVQDGRDVTRRGRVSR